MRAYAGPMAVMILGGTARGRQLAELLSARGVDVMSCLAGRTASRIPLPGRVRVGGFGGADGLALFLRDERPDLLVDATHPFAATMSWNAHQAAAATGVPLLRLAAPSWRQLPDAARWTWVANHDAAAVAIPATGRVLLTVGRQELPRYLPLGDRDVVARVVDPPDVALPPRWTLLRSRGPFDLASERALQAGPPPVATLVTKDSGGTDPDPKLIAAAEIDARVVVIERPPAPVWEHEVATATAAADWIAER